MVEFSPCDLAIANRCLDDWSHKMGRLNRPDHYGSVWCHALFHEGQPVGVACTATLIRERVGGASFLTRSNTVELARVVAARSGLCRVVLRLWREFVFPSLGFPFAISYQDAVMHSGDLYRFDGWRRVSYSKSGFDARSGKQGRKKWVWLWPHPTDAELHALGWTQSALART
jgi:antitoxin VapB